MGNTSYQQYVHWGVYWLLVIAWWHFPTTVVSKIPYFEEFQVLFFMWLQNPRAENGYFVWCKGVELASGRQNKVGAEAKENGEDNKSEHTRDCSQNWELTLSEEQKTQIKKIEPWSEDQKKEMQTTLQKICSLHGKKN